jgi:hypothetical protein
LDLGATDIYLKDSAPIKSINHKHNPIQVTIPNGKSMISLATATLPIPQLPKEATTGYIIPGLNKSLISVTKLCTTGCTVLFRDEECIVKHKKGNGVLRGKKHNKNGLWYIPFLANNTPTDCIIQRDADISQEGSTNPRAWKKS